MNWIRYFHARCFEEWIFKRTFINYVTWLLYFLKIIHWGRTTSDLYYYFSVSDMIVNRQELWKRVSVSLRIYHLVVIRETIGVEIVIVVHDVERKSFGCYYIIMFVSTFQRWLFVLVHFSGLTKKRKEKEKKEFGSFKK